MANIPSIYFKLEKDNPKQPKSLPLPCKSVVKETVLEKKPSGNSSQTSVTYLTVIPTFPSQYLASIVTTILMKMVVFNYLIQILKKVVELLETTRS